MSDAATIAAELTKAQREAVLSAQEKNDGALRTSRWLCQNASRVRGPLLAKGLVYLAVPIFAWRSERRDIVLTDLGLAVRAEILAKETGHAG